MKTINGLLRTKPLLTTPNLAALLFASCGLLALGDGFPPLNVVTNNGTFPASYAARPAPTPPPPPAPLVLPTSPPPAVSFQGLDDNDTPPGPPDTDGWVGPDQVVTMLNTQVRVQDRGGNVQTTKSLLAWWQDFFSDLVKVFDPRVIYDPLGQRWVATASAEPYSLNAAILVAVSASGDPTGGWQAYRFNVNNAGYGWADFPTVGFSSDKVIISWNYVGFQYAVGFFVLSKADIYAGRSVSPQLIYQPEYSRGATNGLNIVPAVSYVANDPTIYLLQDFQDNKTDASYLALYTITGTAGSAVLARSTNFPSGPAWQSAGTNNGDIAPQLGVTTRINTVDSRLSQVVYRNGSLWSVHTVFLPADNPTRCAVQWWQIATDGRVLQNGRIDDQTGATFYAFPSIAVNRFGDVLVGYSRFSPTQYASADYSFHALNDPPGALESDYLYKVGESAYWKTIPEGDPRNRWGDFSTSCVDPANDTDFWTLQEYAAQYSGTFGNGSGRWGVWWANVRVPTPANDAFASAITLSGAQGTTAGTNLRATKETGEPNHAGNAGGASVWYSWTAPASGSATFDTQGSTFNTLLAVYTGSAVGSLTAVASDNGSLGDGASRVIFTAVGGTTYRIAVDGKDGAMGYLALNWLQTPPPVFTLEPQNQTVYAGQSAAFTAFSIGTPPPSYQWQFNGANIIGATATSYTLLSAQPTNAGSYAAVASNTFGSVTSAVAVLAVLTTQATLTGAAYTNGLFRFTVSQASNITYVVQATADLSTTNWIPVATNVAPFTFTEAVAANAARFFRAVPVL